MHSSDVSVGVLRRSLMPLRATGTSSHAEAIDHHVRIYLRQRAFDSLGNLNGRWGDQVLAHQRKATRSSKRAFSQSRRTVRSDTLSAAAISASVIPPKYCISTTKAKRGSAFASTHRA